MRSKKRYIAYAVLLVALAALATAYAPELVFTATQPVPVILAIAPLASPKAPQIMVRFKDKMARFGFSFLSAATDRLRGMTGSEDELYRMDKSGMPLRHFRSNPQLPEWVEEVDKPVYDSFLVTSTTTSATLFSTPIGQSSKTQYHTNMELAGVLPGPQTLLVNRISAYVRSQVIADVALMLHTIVVDFLASGKNYMSCPAIYLPAGFGIGGQTTATNTGTTNNGHPGFDSGRTLALPIKIAPNENFKANLTVYGGAAGVGGAIGTLLASTDFYIYLSGPFARAV